MFASQWTVAFGILFFHENISEYMSGAHSEHSFFLFSLLFLGEDSLQSFISRCWVRSQPKLFPENCSEWPLIFLMEREPWWQIEKNWICKLAFYMSSLLTWATWIVQTTAAFLVNEPSHEQCSRLTYLQGVASSQKNPLILFAWILCAWMHAFMCPFVCMCTLLVYAVLKHIE